MSELCTALGCPELTSVGLSGAQEEQQELRDVIKAAFSEKTFDEWIEVFSKLDACVEPVLSLAEAAEHPQIQARQMVVDVPTPDGKTQKQLACPIKFSAAEIILAIDFGSFFTSSSISPLIF